MALPAPAGDAAGDGLQVERSDRHAGLVARSEHAAHVLVDGAVEHPAAVELGVWADVGATAEEADPHRRFGFEMHRAAGHQTSTFSVLDRPRAATAALGSAWPA